MQPSRYPSFFFCWLLALAVVFSPGAGPARRAGPAPAAAYPWFPFKWYGEKIGGKYFDKLAMLVPVQINDIKANFVTQFDLGSDATVVYENALLGYFASRAQLYARVDTTQRGVTDSGIRNYPTTGLPLAIGATRIAHPRLFAKYGDPIPADSLRTASDKLVGTIGADFCQNKVLVIDYPRHRMCVLDSVDAYWRARTTFVAGRLKHGRFHLPLTINRHTYWALFDTGASLFPFSTDEATWQTVTGARRPTDTMQVSSWGKQVPFYGAPTRYDVYLGARKLPRARAWFTRDQRQLNFKKTEHLDALTGNALFVNSVVVLDFKRQQFGVVNSAGPGR